MDRPPPGTSGEGPVNDHGMAISGTVARGLLEALLSEGEERTRILHTLLAADSAFTDWARQQAATRGWNATTPLELAGRLSQRLVELLGPLVAEYAPGSAEAVAPDSARLRYLVERLARLDQLESDFYGVLEAEKLASLKQLAYGASHEINNPLANISTRAQTLLRDEKDPERRRKLATINSQAFRAHEMIADLMLFAQPPELRYQHVDVPQTIGRVIAELSEWAQQQGTEFIATRPEHAQVIWTDANQLAVAIKALCANALEALRSGGRIEITSTLAYAPDGQEVIDITVRDNGPGMTADVRRHIFDPFFSGREAGRGLGVGLSKCWRIVTQHGGRVDVQSEPGHGAAFTLRFPVSRREVAA